MIYVYYSILFKVLESSTLRHLHLVTMPEKFPSKVIKYASIKMNFNPECQKMNTKEEPY